MRIGIAMSGGVDSTAAALTLRANHDIYGFFMRLAQPNYAEQLAKVQDIADRMAIGLQVIDLREQFQQKVLDYFGGSYFCGQTPNPCMICNREIKFGLFLDTILAAGMEKMATGHYAQLRESQTGFRLIKGIDAHKDQTYFLSRLTQYQLASVLFPLGTRRKEEIYEYVEANGFNHFRGQESQDVCFLDHGNVGNFIATFDDSKDKPGPIRDTSGKILGKHQGIFRYTVGQRKGLGISCESPLYVIEIDVATNTIIVGKNEDLFKTRVNLRDIKWISTIPPDLSRTYSVRIRYTHRGADAQIVETGNNEGYVEFFEAQRAITPGQFAVVYDGEELLGSGVITSPRKTKATV